MRVLITGGAGFLGSHLCEHLLNGGHDVVCMDNLLTGSIDNVAHLSSRSSFGLVRHDVTEYISLDGPVDYVLHFASPASPADYLQYPIQTLKVGSLGTHKALGFAKFKGAKFLLASTSEVYGDPQVNPQTESYWGHVNPIGLRGVYDEAKRFGEAITMAYHRVHGLDTKIVRIFNTYGPRMRPDDGRAIPAFIDQALRGVPLTIHGDGSQTRSFCYVSDLVGGIERLMLSTINGPVNLGNPEEMTILTLANKILNMTGSSSRLDFRPFPEDDPKIRRPGIVLAQKDLGWEPQVGLEEGLKKTIQWFKGVDGDRPGSLRE